MLPRFHVLQKGLFDNENTVCELRTASRSEAPPCRADPATQWGALSLSPGAPRTSPFAALASGLFTGPYLLPCAAPQAQQLTTPASLGPEASLPWHTWPRPWSMGRACSGPPAPPGHCLAGVGSVPGPSCCMCRAEGGRYSDRRGRRERVQQTPGNSLDSPTGGTWGPGTDPATSHTGVLPSPRKWGRGPQCTVDVRVPARRNPKSDRPPGVPQTGPPAQCPHAEGTRDSYVNPGHAGFQSNCPTATATELSA